jgi:hypothetical protein
LPDGYNENYFRKAVYGRFQKLPAGKVTSAVAGFFCCDADGGTLVSFTGFCPDSFNQCREIAMWSKLAIPALVAASLFATAPIATAQAASAAGASSANNAMASMRHHHRYHHHMRYTRSQMDRSRPGGRPVSRKAPG